MATQSVLIKKYENRRLYDATNSRYVNLEEVAQLVQQGYDVQVVDAASGEDITRVVLTQIIAEGAKAADSNFPLDILRQMVIASGRASQESAIRYTKAMLDLYQSTYKAMVPTLNPFEFLHGQPLSSSQAQAGGVDLQGAADGREAGGNEVSQLKARLAELERAVSDMASQKAPRVTRRPAAKRAKKAAGRKK
ncbi:MAG TPA: polyhydroxyalkanoate synthesis regulator DNA-binding domain-containing protein [Terracidiphilus sp.]|jgi:polyhydroxyalkanoate synthesis repressor PhaR